MYIGEVLQVDIANGPGMRTTVFVSGCRRHCRGCFNEVAWDFRYGKRMDEALIRKILEMTEPGYVAGMTLLGGEPLEKENQEGVLQLLEALHGKMPEKTVWCYSGYTLEEILDGAVRTEWTDRILGHIQVLVDGPFVEEEKDLTLRFRGNRNQRILDLPGSLRAGKAVEWKDDPLFASHEL